MSPQSLLGNDRKGFLRTKTEKLFAQLQFRFLFSELEYIFDSLVPVNLEPNFKPLLPEFTKIQFPKK